MKVGRSLRRGIVAGVLATACEAAWSQYEPSLIGRRPLFDTSLMATRFIRSATGHSPSDATALRAGALMRAAYGPAWGGLLGLVTARRKPPLVRSTLLLAATIWLVELALLPRAKATPPLRRWPEGDVFLDLTNTLVYAAVATVANRAGRRDERA